MFMGLSCCWPNSLMVVIDLLFLFQAEITIVKLQNRVHVYGVEGGFPMFFDIDGRGTEIFPTGSSSLLILG